MDPPDKIDPEIFQKVVSERLKEYELIDRAGERAADIIWGRVQERHRQKTASHLPHTSTKNGQGYLQLGTEGKKKLIGRASAQPFRLLSCLLDPGVGVARSIDAMFDSVKLPRHNKDSKFTNPTTAKQAKRDTIERVFKELQRGNKLQGKLSLQFDEAGNKVWLEYTE